MDDVIIVKFKGGLGNQMFQYALYKKLKKEGKRVKADLSHYSEEQESMPFVLEKVFPKIILERADKKETNYYTQKQNEMSFIKKGIAFFNWKARYYTSEKENGVFNKKVFSLRKGVVDGYWQSEKYFTDIKEELIDDFEFDIKDVKLQQYQQSIIPEAVSVHIRRGDYLKHPEIYGDICDLDYYKRAMDYLCEKLVNPQFYFFSDDLEWVKSVFNGYNITIVNRENYVLYQDWYDMFLMSKCKCNIIANSSFSWWGAWLNRNDEKLVIAPKNWFQGEETPDIWCPEWKRM